MRAIGENLQLLNKLEFDYQPMSFSLYLDFAQSHVMAYLFVLLILKIMGIIYPPLPSAVFTITAIPLIGWKLAYVMDILGSAIGATSAYYLGKKYGECILKKVIGITLSNKIRAIKLKQKNQLESAIVLRLASGGLLSDGLAWGASLIGFTYVPFIAGYLISHIATTLPVFFLITRTITLTQLSLI